MAGDPPQQHDTKPPAGWFTRFLNTVEWLGNLLPHPVTLFACFTAGIVLLSGVAAWFGLSVVDPRPEGIPGRSADGIIHVVSLVSVDGLQRIVSNLVANFTGFPPLGVVLMTLLGVSIAEHSGLIGAAMRGLVLGAAPYGHRDRGVQQHRLSWCFSPPSSSPSSAGATSAPSSR